MQAGITATRMNKVAPCWSRDGAGFRGVSGVPLAFPAKEMTQAMRVSLQEYLPS